GLDGVGVVGTVNDDARLGPDLLHAAGELGVAQPLDHVDLGQVELVRLELVEHGQGQAAIVRLRSEEHTSELQSRENIVCRLLLRRPPRPALFPYATLFRSRAWMELALWAPSMMTRGWVQTCSMRPASLVLRSPSITSTSGRLNWCALSLSSMARARPQLCA